MQLSPGERSVLAFFPSADSASKAAEALTNAGYPRPSVDRVSRYGVTYDSNINNPINNALTVTGPTLFSDSTSEEMTDTERILRVSDPSVSGYGNVDYGVAGGKAFLLTLVTSSEKARQAEKMIEEHGGKI
ncbi:MAG: hypothetical protein ACOY46_20100 [Bacillota bacterium]